MSPCWLWKGCVSKSGYGSLGRTFAHRLVYEQLVRPIPAGMTLDHLCRKTSCVNPEHLEVVSLRVNILRGVSPPAIKARQEKCSVWHDFSRDKNGRRFCKPCRATRAVKTYWRGGRTRELEQKKIKYLTPGYRNALLEKKRERWAADPEYRARLKAQMKAWRQRQNAAL